MIAGPADNPLFRRIEPHDFYQPIQVMLNQLKRETPEDQWQEEFYTQQIKLVIDTHFSFELDLYDVANLSTNRCDSLMTFLSDGLVDLGNVT